MAKKYFTDESLATFVDEIKSYTDSAVSTKADTGHTHPEATIDTAGLLSASDKIQLNYGGIPIITTSGDGAAYTATVDGMDTLTKGMSFIMIPHTVSTATAPTLNVNSLGAKSIRRRLSSATTSTSAGYNASWLSANKPVRVEYDGTFWIADLPKPVAADMSGTLPVSNGGTGKTSVTAGNFLVGNGTSALTEKTPAETLVALGITATATELNYMDGVTSNVQAQLDSKADANHTHGASGGLRGYTTSDFTTAAKVVTLYASQSLTLEPGMIFMVDFAGSGDNMMNNVTLNINGTGAYPIMVDGSTFTGYDSKYTGKWSATITYMFNGTHYVWLNTDYGAASANRIVGGTFGGHVSAYCNSSSDGAPTTYILRNSVITTEVQDVAGLLYQPRNGEIKWYYK